MTARLGDWMQTYSGRAFWPLDPRPEEVCIEDIAHALSLQCRFAGHVPFHYSVAQHSVLVSEHLSGDDTVWGLLHDASEAYLVDLPSPVKQFMDFYRAYEDKLMKVIADHFGLKYPFSNAVKIADAQALATEKRDLMKKEPREWQKLPEPFATRILAESPEKAEFEFLVRARELGVRGAEEALSKV